MEIRSNKLGEIRRYYSTKLKEVFDQSEAEKLLLMLLETYSEYSRANIIAFPDKTINESQLLKIHFGVKDLLNHKPIQYILGETEFYGLKFRVNPGVLIPRPETEEMVDRIIGKFKIRKGLRILDIGTGSGCIAVALAKNLHEAKVTAFDISREALEIAGQNASLNAVTVTFDHYDILSHGERNNKKQFDLIVSNPPYVRQSERKEMKPNVTDYEPAIALFVPDEDPLVYYRAIANYALATLHENGKLVCEISQYLPDEVLQLMENSGFKNVELEKDMFRNYRFIWCNK